jgi:hypothetical protein
MPNGPLSPVDEVAGLIVVKDDCPITKEAASCVEKGVVYSKILLFDESATHRLPEASKVIPYGRCSPVEVVVAVPVVRSGWPITKEAASPVDKGVVYSRILLFR